MPEPDDPYFEHWYEVVEDDSLRQGDILRDLIAYRLPENLPVQEDDPDPDQLALEAEWVRSTWIIMTASCDLDQHRCRDAFLAEVLPANPDNFNADSEKEFEQKFEVLRKGHIPNKFLLPDCDLVDPPFQPSVAYFRSNVSLPIDYLQRNCGGERLRLRHPFREKFGNWVGERMSEVGPEDYATMPGYDRRIFEAHILRYQDD